MRKLSDVLSNGFGSLAVVLMVLGVLTASPYVWGDEPCTSDSCPSGMVCENGACQQQPASCLPNPSVDECYHGMTPGSCLAWNCWDSTGNTVCICSYSSSCNCP